MSGVLKSVLKAKGIDANVWEASCKATGGDACVFHGEIIHKEQVPMGAEKVRELLGG